jgi:adenosylhomocysteine nucleosidase
LSATGVVAALGFEARCLGTRRRRGGGLSSLHDGSLVSISGMGADNATRAARTLVAAGAGALLSWGVAGALDPSLDCGTIVLPSAVLRRCGGPGAFTLLRHETCRTWRERLLGALQGSGRVVSGALISSATPVAQAALKARLLHETGAVAVDMESAAVAEVAAQHGLPFIAVRVILDTAADSLPESVLRALAPAGSSGRAHTAPLLWALLRRPSDLSSLLRLAAQYRLARRCLRDCARRAAPTRLIDSPGQG